MASWLYRREQFLERPTTVKIIELRGNNEVQWSGLGRWAGGRLRHVPIPQTATKKMAGAVKDVKED